MELGWNLMDCLVEFPEEGEWKRNGMKLKFIDGIGMEWNGIGMEWNGSGMKMEYAIVAAF